MPHSPGGWNGRVQDVIKPFRMDTWNVWAVQTCRNWRWLGCFISILGSNWTWVMRSPITYNALEFHGDWELWSDLRIMGDKMDLEEWQSSEGQQRWFSGLDLRPLLAPLLAKFQEVCCVGWVAPTFVCLHLIWICLRHLPLSRPPRHQSWPSKNNRDPGTLPFSRAVVLTLSRTAAL